MSEPYFSTTADDDLPLAIRREREVREREMRERAAAAVPSIGPDAGYRMLAQPAVVTALDIPFFKLMAFLIKAVLAGLPALLVLTALLWLLGQGVQAAFPQLIKMKILIHFPH
jgi:hypothetical protein